MNKTWIAPVFGLLAIGLAVAPASAQPGRQAWPEVPFYDRQGQRIGVVRQNQMNGELDFYDLQGNFHTTGRRNPINGEMEYFDAKGQRLVGPWTYPTPRPQ